MCRAGCPTPGAHSSWGACARDAGIQIDKHGLAGHRGVEQDKDKRLHRYADAKSQGLQPASTQWRDVRNAFETGGVAHTAHEAPKVSAPNYEYADH